MSLDALAEVFEMRGMSAVRRLVLLRAADWAGFDGATTSTAARLSDAIEMPVDEVQAVIQQVIDKGILRREWIARAEREGLVFVALAPPPAPPKQPKTNGRRK